MNTVVGRDHSSSRFRWARAVALGLLLALFTIGFFQRFSPATFSAPIGAEFGLSAAQLGVFAAANFWVYTAMQVPVGVLIDRYGTRLVVCAGGAVTALGTVVLGVAPGYGVALLGPMLVGLGTSGIFVGLMKFNATWFPAYRYGLVTGLTMFVGNLGSILAEGPSAGLLSVLSWRSIFLTVGVVSMVVTVAAWFTVRDTPEARGFPRVVAPAPSGDGSSGGSVLRDVVRSRQLWAVFFAVVGTNGTFYAFSGLWGVPMLRDSFDLDNRSAALYTTVALAVYGVGNLAVGFVSDRMGRRRPLILACSVSALLGWAGLVWAPWEPGVSAIVLYVLVGLAGSQVVVGFAAVKESFPPAVAATALGVVNVGAFLASGLIQPVFGAVLDVLAGDSARALGDYRVALGIPLVLAVVGFVFSLRVRETLGPRGGVREAHDIA
ncbi:MFS transporter [Saccharomonospora iraqiensis]|uniref:MFS transporter n=1 Tax=Saccharomonospora iraqiensis TaxID=52698 RepID=UPI000426AF2E|nr:MFS transporter [Saccharomonospora iraqiensis]